MKKCPIKSNEQWNCCQCNFPIIVMSSLSDEDLAVTAVQIGEHYYSQMRNCSRKLRSGNGQNRSCVDPRHH